MFASSIFFYSFSILSKHDLGILFLPAIVKMYSVADPGFESRGDVEL